MGNKLKKTTPNTLAAFIELSGKDIVYGAWDGWLFPCPKGCSYINHIYSNNYYEPCKYCGATMYTNRKTGRKVYVKVPFLWFFTKKKFLGYQWRD